MFSGIITTCDRYTEEESKHGGIIDSSKLNRIKEIQTVVSTSEQASARGVGNGTVVAVSFERYKKSKQVKRQNSVINDIDEHFDKTVYYDIPLIRLDGKEHLLIDVSDVEMIINDYEYITEGEGLLTGVNSFNFELGKSKLIS